MKKITTLLFTIAVLQSQAQSPAEKLGATVLNIWKDTVPIGSNTKWSYDMGVTLKGFEGLWLNTGNAAWFTAIQKKIDYFVKDDGSIKNYEKDDYNLDMINNGKLVLLLYRVTGKEKYKKAADLLRSQLLSQPRTNEGGFWHKKIYPWQMWLDGLYMAEPFYAEYAMLFHQDTAFNDIANQFIWIEKHTRDPKTGLLYHGWDESKTQQWANKTTGLSPHFWSRAMGWYSDAIVDVLDYFPANHPKRKALIDILNRLVNALGKYQDKTTGVWYDILNYSGPNKEKNYLEASASCQFTYAIAKGVRKGYLPASKMSMAQKAYAGILKQFIKEENGKTVLTGTVKGSGLGGNPYRDGTFTYYMSEPVITNDPKGMGAFLLAANEMEMSKTQSLGKGKTVLLDRWFNSEKKKDATGAEVYWHYVWNDRSNSGFSTFGHVFEKYGAQLASLDVAPTAANMKTAAVYVIVDPDHIRDNPNPNYVTEKDAQTISNWVKAGGTLLLMANDSNNCDLKHFNILASKFGISFTDKSLNMVKNDIFEQGVVYPGDNNPIFKTTKKMYLKEISALAIQSPATANAVKDGDVIIATANYGKGKVLAVGDPWLYNEYADGRKLPAEYENYKAAEDLVQWLLSTPKK
ncbi:MAG: glycoside hydrolase family 88 protein [Bacteroidetes bacterium]|nr:glycoside hydrolase family 88 protein [Bacteroidota bacterium]